MANATREETTQRPRATNESKSQREQQELSVEPLNDLVTAATTYVRENPEMAVIYAFGVGFVLGWKLKPW